MLTVLVTACTGSEAAVQVVETFPDAQTRRRAASPVRAVAVSSSEASFTAIPRVDQTRIIDLHVNAEQENRSFGGSVVEGKGFRDACGQGKTPSG